MTAPFWKMMQERRRYHKPYPPYVPFSFNLHTLRCVGEVVPKMSQLCQHSSLLHTRPSAVECQVAGKEGVSCGVVRLKLVGGA
jgi:hypothetical protein